MALAAPVTPAWSGMIGEEALAGPTQAEVDRAKVRAFLERADLRERLQAMGVNGLSAADRVATLTDAEVHALAERIDTLPAGGALSNQDLILIVLIAILIAILI